MTGAKLAAMRKAAGWSQHELARRAGLARNTVSYWERMKFVDLSAWAISRMRWAGPLNPDFRDHYACVRHGVMCKT